ncbi:MAG: phosphate acetyltransferase [Omnitrophica bacterium GWA2_41_15]|nr:MAG: phosphate acetyltransferase [Omnitrophica bacterium GWA2_41_15]HAZ09828.1 phosphate acetyltransferase [Candidatus Omnitrophota bacterium]
MNFLEKIYERGRKTKKKILLSESHDERVLRAIESILKSGICVPVLIGNPEEANGVAKKQGIDLKGLEIIDNKKSKDLDKYVGLYCEKRKHKKISSEDALKIITENPVFYASLMVSAGDADGSVAGASITTRDVAKAAIYCIGPAENIKTVSSSTLLILGDKTLGSSGIFIYADAGIVPDPTADELADIAISSARMAKILLDDQPKIAMLSYSTKGSGGFGKSIQKVQEATRIVRKREPGLLIDGEIQADCAVVPEVAQRKDSDSRIKGRANIFIFPNLDAGNISYKLTQRLARARAIGPLLQGLQKPASDLSRGCDFQDIIDAVAITAVRAQGGLLI